MKNKRVRYLLSKWYVFVVWAVLMGILGHYVTAMIVRPSPDEKISVFVCSESCDQIRLVENLQDARPSYVKQMDFKWVDPKDSLFSIYYDAFAVDGGDLIVLPESKLNEYSYVDFFELDAVEVEQRFGQSFEYYRTDDGKIYGIKIDAEKSLGKQPDNSTQIYYLFFNKNSFHLGEWKESPRAGAVILAQVFL